MILALGIIYVIIGIIVVSLVLLHSGRGGGLSDMPAPLANNTLAIAWLGLLSKLG